jgi:hypothetical protein
VTRDSAALRFIRTARRYGLEVPECVAKRHRAGVERLLDEMSREYLDEKRVGDLLALIK